jgi:hypothetical protein
MFLRQGIEFGYSDIRDAGMGFNFARGIMDKQEACLGKASHEGFSELLISFFNNGLLEEVAHLGRLLLKEKSLHISVGLGDVGGMAQQTRQRGFWTTVVLASGMGIFGQSLNEIFILEEDEILFDQKAAFVRDY